MFHGVEEQFVRVGNNCDHSVTSTGARLSVSAEPSNVNEANKGRRKWSREFLPAQPTDLVELVHAHINENTTAARAEGRGRWLGIPLIARNEVQFSQITCDYALPQTLQ